MDDHRKPTLVLLLFPVFETAELREEFMSFLKIALVVTESHFIKTLEYQQERDTPKITHKFLGDEAAAWDGPLALICFAGNGEGAYSLAMSKIGTFDQFVPKIRPARKVLVVGSDIIDKPSVVGVYDQFGAETGPVKKPVFIMQRSHMYPVTLARELGSFLGNRLQPRAPTATFLAVASKREDEPTDSHILEQPVRKRRDDETVTNMATEQLARLPRSKPTPRVFEAVRPSPRPDPRREDGEEDERPTLEPPPPDIPFRPKQ